MLGRSPSNSDKYFLIMHRLFIALFIARISLSTYSWIYSLNIIQDRFVDCSTQAVGKSRVWPHVALRCLLLPRVAWRYLTLPHVTSYCLTLQRQNCSFSVLPASELKQQNEKVQIKSGKWKSKFISTTKKTHTHTHYFQASALQSRRSTAMLTNFECILHLILSTCLR